MYTRCCVFQRWLTIVQQPKRCLSTSNGDIFYNLTSDYNRRRFIHRDFLSNAIESIHSNLSERHSLVILTAAARHIHHVTPKQRVQFLEQVESLLLSRKELTFLRSDLEEISRT